MVASKCACGKPGTVPALTVAGMRYVCSHKCLGALRQAADQNAAIDKLRRKWRKDAGDEE